MHSILIKRGLQFLVSVAFCSGITAFALLNGSAMVAGPNANTSQETTVSLERAPVEEAAEALTNDHAAPKRSVKPKKRQPTLLPVVSQKDILARHQQLADSVLRSVHPGCRNTLKNFYVRYDNPDQRGLGGGNTIIVTGNVPDAEFRALLVHECAHLIDLTAIQGTRAAGPTSFQDGSQMMYADDPSVSFYAISWIDHDTKNRGAKDADFVSGYASWDMFEDFSETYTYYMLQRDAFIERAKTNPALAMKLAWMQQNLPSEPLGIGTAWNKTIPWDTTKLAYTWTNAVEVAKK